MTSEKKGFPIILAILAIIIGAALYKEFDFETLRFKKIGLGIVYLITFVGLVVMIVRGSIRKG